MKKGQSILGNIFVSFFFLVILILVIWVFFQYIPPEIDKLQEQRACADAESLSTFLLEFTNGNTSTIESFKVNYTSFQSKNYSVLFNKTGTKSSFQFEYEITGFDTTTSDNISSVLPNRTSPSVYLLRDNTQVAIRSGSNYSNSSFRFDLLFPSSNITSISATSGISCQSEITGGNTSSWLTDTETEWNEGSFTNTTTDGSGNLVLSGGPAYPVGGGVSEYRFETGSGSTAYDTWDGNDGSLESSMTDSDWVSSKGDKGTGDYALDFDGGDDYVELTTGDLSGTLASGSNVVTVTGWINPDTLSSSASNHGTRNVIFAKASDGDNDNIEIGVSDTNNLDFYIDENADDTAKTYGNGELTTGSWHHFVATFDSGNIDVYLDGNHYTGSFSGTSLDGAGSSPVTLGVTRHSDIYFYGTIDEVRVYSQALTQTEIQEIYNADYETSGTYDSKTLDANESVTWKSSSVTATTPTNTNYNIDYAENSSGSWTYYDSISSVPDSGYLQYNMTLTGNGTVTPSIDSVNITYSTGGDYSSLEEGEVIVEGNITGGADYEEANITLNDFSDLAFIKSAECKGSCPIYIGDEGTLLADHIGPKIPVMSENFCRIKRRGIVKRNSTEFPARFRMRTW